MSEAAMEVELILAAAAIDQWRIAGGAEEVVGAMAAIFEHGLSISHADEVSKLTPGWGRRMASAVILDMADQIRKAGRTRIDCN